MKKAVALLMCLVLALSLIACRNLFSDMQLGAVDSSDSDLEIPWRPGTGDTLELGGYRWKVLCIKNHKALLITEDVIALKSYNNTDDYVLWSDSSLCEWLNDDFAENFSTAELSRITNTHLESDGDEAYRLFLLSPEEMATYLPENTSRIAQLRLPPAEASEGQGEAVSYWTRYIPRDSDYYPTMRIVDTVGELGNAPRLIDLKSLTQELGVRPAFWLQVE